MSNAVYSLALLAVLLCFIAAASVLRSSLAESRRREQQWAVMFREFSAAHNEYRAAKEREVAAQCELIEAQREHLSLYERR